MSAEGQTARVLVPDRGGIARVLDDLDLALPRPVLVVVGGADAMDHSVRHRFEALLISHVVPVVQEKRAIVIDGGTDSGVMRAMGRARQATGARFPLIGVSPSHPANEPEPHHSHFLVVPGDSFGDESEWIAEIASAAARSQPSATLLANGGEVALGDVEFSLRANRPVVVLDGSGRAADDIAAALSGRAAPPRVSRIADSSLVSCLPLDDGESLRSLLARLL